MIELRSVRKTYGDTASRVEALKGIDLQVDPGQFVSIMGPSGSGKTTLLHLMSALDVPSSGSIRIDGQDTRGLDEAAKNSENMCPAGGRHNSVWFGNRPLFVYQKSSCW